MDVMTKARLPTYKEWYKRRVEKGIMQETGSRVGIIVNTRQGGRYITMSEEEGEFLCDRQQACQGCHHVRAFHWEHSVWIGDYETGDEENASDCIMTGCGCAEFKEG